LINILVFALLQAVAGDPAPAAPHATHEQTAPASSGGEAPAAGEVAPATEQSADAAPAERQYRRERRCREVEVTGRRMPQRVCQNVMVPVEEGETAN